METIVDLEKLYHRSKRRIKDLGEVFTPEAYVENMLDLLAKNKRGIWSDETISFFEPCAGHGNIAIAIYKRRLDGIYKKAIANGNNEAPYYATANALNTLWAIDIDHENVENCRSRILATTLLFLKDKLKIDCDKKLFSSNPDFFAHILSAIKWHIEVNETMSALSDSDSARSKADLTKSGSNWFAQNGHHQLDFDLTWVSFYEECEGANTVPIEFERSSRFVEGIISGRLRGLDDYGFAKIVVNNAPPKESIFTDESNSVSA